MRQRDFPRKARDCHPAVFQRQTTWICSRWAIAIIKRMSPAEIHDLFVTAVGHHNAANLSEAEKIYHRILAAHPDHPDALHLLGRIAHQRGQSQAAVALIQKAIDINPGNAEYYANLGAAMLPLEQYPPAADALRTAVRMNPRLADAYSNLGLALVLMADAEPAAAALRSALELNPKLHEAHRVLGGALSLMGQHDAAVSAFRAALRLKPDWPATHSDLIFTMLHDPASDNPAIQAELTEWNRLYAAPLRHLIQPHRIDRSPDRRLRIGWVSSDFRWHVVARCLLPLLDQFDRRRFRIFCYSNVANPDDMTDRISAAADVWRNIYRVPDEQAAQIIRSDRIDILIDLGLHTGHNRLTLFALKPAPLQVTYLGYCGSTGVETMDYRISDPYIDPPDADLPGYSERTLRMSSSFFCYSPEASPPEVAPLTALSRTYLTFGCLNNSSKISSAVLKLWAQVLQSVPASHLLLHAPPGEHRQGILAVLDRSGIASDRVEFVSKQSWLGYMQTYNRIDIALDPFPYGGGITTCDALFMGVPVVTRRGATGVGRLSYSILCNIGRSDLAADSPQQYVDIAINLAANPTRLSELRSALRPALQASPVMDAAGTAVNLGNLFLEIWQKRLHDTV